MNNNSSTADGSDKTRIHRSLQNLGIASFDRNCQGSLQTKAQQCIQTACGGLVTLVGYIFYILSLWFWLFYREFANHLPFLGYKA